ncbi:hypothetical protein ACVDFE_35895 [Lentzea chajnantorensis]
MSTEEDLRRLLAEIADTASTDAADLIRRRLTDNERGTAARSQPPRS